MAQTRTGDSSPLKSAKLIAGFPEDLIELLEQKAQHGEPR
jgi:hypothetical protein